MADLVTITGLFFSKKPKEKPTRGTISHPAKEMRTSSGGNFRLIIISFCGNFITRTRVTYCEKKD